MSDDVETTESLSRTATEVEVLPDYGVEQADLDYKALLEKFKDRALFVDGVRKEALSRTKPHHWLGRKAKDGVSLFNLMGPGAERIKTTCPIGFVNKVRREEKWNKESGSGYTIYYDADVYLGSPKAGILPVIGSCSSDDDFFSMEHTSVKYNAENPEQAAALESGEGRLSGDKQTLYIRRRVPADEVSKENIEKSALTNLIVNGVTRVLGVRQMDEESLKEVGIDLGKIQSIEYGSTRKQSGRITPAGEQKRSSIWDMLLEIHEGNDGKAAAALKKFTAFNDYAGQDNPQKLSEKQINICFGKVEAAYKKFKGEPPKEKKEGQRERL